MKIIKFMNIATAKQKISLLPITSLSKYRDHFKTTWMTYEEAKRSLKSLGITSSDEYFNKIN